MRHDLLDTNVCVMYLNGRSETVRNRIQSTPEDQMVVCSIVKAEMFYGALRSQNPIRNLEAQQAFLKHFISLTFDDDAAQVFDRSRF